MVACRREGGSYPIPRAAEGVNLPRINEMTRVGAFALVVLTASPAVRAQPPTQPNKVERPTVKVLLGLTVPQFEQEMQGFVQALGISCGGCHAARGNFASDENPRKVRARQMIEMTRTVNKQLFPEHTPAEGESTSAASRATPAIMGS
jgi:hypothetical protein